MVTTFRLGFDVLLIIFTRVAELAVQQQKVDNFLRVMTAHNTTSFTIQSAQTVIVQLISETSEAEISWMMNT